MNSFEKTKCAVARPKFIIQRIMNHNFSSTCNVSLQNSKAKSAVAPNIYPVPYFLEAIKYGLLIIYTILPPLWKKGGQRRACFSSCRQHLGGVFARVLLLI